MALCEVIKMRVLFGQLKTKEHILFLKTLMESNGDYIMPIIKGLYNVIQDNDNFDMALTCNQIMRKIIQSRTRNNPNNTKIQRLPPLS